ncbi:MAG: hypothetical protein MHM6MM_000212 [Cercozoa sp. M6MM]
MGFKLSAGGLLALLALQIEVIYGPAICRLLLASAVSSLKESSSHVLLACLGDILFCAYLFFRVKDIRWGRVQVSYVARALLLCVVGLGMHYALTTWVPSTSYPSLSLINIVDPVEGGVSVPRVLTVVLLSPLKEELVFRVLALQAAQDMTNSVLFAVSTQSMLFAMLHSLNTATASVSRHYVWLQIVFGLVCGLNFGLRAHLSGVLECVVLHVMNNAFAMFVPQLAMFDLYDNVTFLLLLQALGFQLWQLYLSFQQYRQQQRRVSPSEHASNAAVRAKQA